ncbi:MAG: ABC transporter permease [Bacteriovoracaceae bacterium]|nr:ABC transporter permease [Bacteriovoracaceae bacterium]
MNQRIFQRLYWEQVKNLTVANMKSRYRKTFAGFLWVVMSPILIYSVQSLVFKHFLKIAIPNYSLFLLGGILPWIFVTTSIEMCTPLFLTTRDVLLGFKINPLVILLSQLLDNFFNFLFAFLILLIPTWIFFGENIQGLPYLIFALINLVLGVTGVTWILSILQVFYRDTRFVLPFITNVALFLTPIFYPPEFVPENIRAIIVLNPLYILILPVRTCIYNFGSSEFLNQILAANFVTASSLLIAFYYWRKKRNEFYIHL